MAAAFKQFKPMCLLVLILLTTGCAALTIDVDVYKGPLANHEEVQLEQMAVMAVAAKPLLEELCIRLEEAASLNNKEKREARERCKPSSEIYDFDEKVQRSNEHFQSTGGERIKAILSLYEDQSLKELAELIIPLKKNLRAYVSNFPVIRPQDEAHFLEYEKVWEKIEAGMGVEFNKGHPLMKSNSPIIGQQEEFKLDLEKLKDAYKGFIQGNVRLSFDGKLGRDQDKIYKAHWSLYENHHAQIPAGDVIKYFRYNLQVPTESGFLFPYFKDLSVPLEDRDSQTSANSEYRALPSYAKIHAELLFQNGQGEAKILFLDQINKISHTFLKARERLNELLHLSLEIIKRTDASKSGSYTSVAKIREAAARFAAQLINPSYLYCALENEEGRKEVVKTLRRRVKDSFSIWRPTGNYRKFLEFEYTPPEEWVLSFLRNLLVKEQLSDHMLKVHEDYKYTYAYTNEARGTKCETQERYKYRPHREFGLTTGPVALPPTSHIEKLGNTVTNKLKALGGLERGRLSVGLNTLIEEFLEKRINHLGGPESKDQKQLIDALVRFAQKVLSLSNQKTLLTKKNSYPDNIYKPEEGSLDEETLVLQSIGNSILVQANELRERSSHKDDLEKSGPHERHAVKLIYSSDPQIVLDDLISAIEGKTNVHQVDDNTYQKEITKLINKISGLEAKLAPLKGQLETKNTLSEEKKIDHEKAKLALSYQKLANQLVSCSSCPSSFDGQNLSISGTKPESLAEFQEKLKRFVELANPFSDQPGVKLKNKIIILFNSLIADHQDQDSKEGRKILSAVKTSFWDISPVNITKLPRTEAFGQLKDELASLVNADTAAVVAAGEEFDEVQAEINKLDQQVEKLHAKLQAKKEKKKQGEYNRKLATEIILTRDAINAKKKNVLDAIGKKISNEPKSYSPGPRDTIKELLTVFEKELKNSVEADDGKKAEWISAIKHVKLHPIPFFPLGTSEPQETSKQVLDDVIASLRQKHIKAVGESGPDTEPAKRIAAALKTALNYRSNMIYIRPSSMYLRSSYPATSLQDDPGLTRKNMLQEQALRSLPILGGAFDCLYGNCPWGADKNKRKIVSEIDKQFWQNINQVKVTGGGITNYVIAKDDIGNWYVKEVATDPEPIIKSARNLALYGLGSGLNTNLVGRVQEQSQNESPTQVGAQNAASQTTPLERLFSKYEIEYQSRTKNDFEELKTAVSSNAKSLPDQIKKAWASNKSLSDDHDSQLGDALEAAQGNFESSRKEMNNNTETEASLAKRPAKITRGLQGIRRFHNQLIGLIKGMGIPTPKVAELTVAQAAKAQADQELGNAQQTVEEAEKSKEAVEKRLTALRDVNGPEKTVAEQDMEKAKDDLEKASNLVSEKKRVAEEKALMAAAKQKEVEIANANEDAAIKTVTSTVKAVLERVVASRKEGNKAFETSITFLGDATRE